MARARTGAAAKAKAVKLVRKRGARYGYEQTEDGRFHVRDYRTGYGVAFYSNEEAAVEMAAQLEQSAKRRRPELTVP